MPERFGDQLTASEDKGRFFSDVSTSRRDCRCTSEATPRREYERMVEIEVWTGICGFDGNPVTRCVQFSRAFKRITKTTLRGGFCFGSGACPAAAGFLRSSAAACKISE